MSLFGRPSGCGCLSSCLLIPLAIVVVVAGIVAWFVASMGLVNIPVFTSLAYHQPQPVHVVSVSAATSAQSLLSPDLLSQLQQVSSGNISPQDISSSVDEKTIQDFLAHLQSLASVTAQGNATFTIPESALTATLRQGASNSSSGPFDLSASQIAVTQAQGLEIFLPMRNNPVGSAVRLDVEPSLINGELSAAITHAYVGDVELPPNLVSGASANTIQAALNAVGPSLKTYATFNSLSVVDGAVILQGKISVP